MKLMKLTLTMTTALFVAIAAAAADTAPTNQVADAIAKLKAATNYSWTSTLKIADSDFNIGPVKGQAGREGFAKMSQNFNDNTTEIVLKGGKVAYKGEEGWQLLGEGGGMETFFAAEMARNGAAAQEAEMTLKNVKEVKALDGKDRSSFGLRTACSPNMKHICTARSLSARTKTKWTRPGPWRSRTSA